MTATARKAVSKTAVVRGRRSESAREIMDIGREAGLFLKKAF
jgi:hypothetical protein